MSHLYWSLWSISLIILVAKMIAYCFMILNDNLFPEKSQSMINGLNFERHFLFENLTSLFGLGDVDDSFKMLVALLS